MASAPTPRTTLKRIPVSNLVLDPENPRLVVPAGASQAALLAELYNEEALDELVTSLVENGYFDEEPLVVVAAGKTYKTVEGNRRLATLKLLLSPQLRARVGATDWPKLTRGQSERLRVVPCIVYKTRADVIPFLGYRHITGAKKWAPFQKARFVDQLLREGQSLSHIQELIGDTTQATKKLYQDFVVYRQMVDDVSVPPERIRQRFSLLEVALGQRPIKKFLGMPFRLPTHSVDGLVPEDSLDQLQEITQWIFGSDIRQALIADSREIPLLAKVVSNKEALEHLRLTNDLDGAYERTGGEQEFLLRRLAAAERATRDAAGLLPLYVENRDVKSAVDRLVALVRGLGRQTSN